MISTKFSAAVAGLIIILTASFSANAAPDEAPTATPSSILADLKTTAKPPKKPYPDQIWQLGGYHLAADLPPKDSYILVIDQATGILTPHTIPQDKIEEGIETFKSIRDAWIRIKKYDPRKGGK